MRGLVQRVTEAAVRVDGEFVGRIGPGLCVLVGVTHDDDGPAAAKLAAKLWMLRIFDDTDGAMNLSASDLGAEVLVISQFTLWGADMAVSLVNDGPVTLLVET
ncbi:MAG: D-aminoacyl-tRNA deacylase [Acidimicrobiia bacterium]|nr:D-aminoacyl-tRNA deacylase [Acidimicrobiia bacterium]